MSRSIRFLAMLGLIILSGGIALAQVKSSSITGIITDPSGAVVPNASVVVTNQDTNIATEVKTNAEGSYNVPYLSAGRYSLKIQAGGFRTYHKTDIVMGTGTIVRADAVLETGALEITVEVKASAVELQTESSTVQGSVDSNTILNIPNLTNNPLYYATLQAGVIPTYKMYDGKALGVGVSDRQAYSGMRINGGMLGTNDVQIDGVSVQGAAWHESTVMPNRDSLQEVRVSTNTFAADLGNGQGLISLITKSGTNQFHGTLGFRGRNEALNANGFFNNQQGIKRSPYRVNEYSGSVGGPVILPKIFNGKDKLFFFASFSRITHSEPDNYVGYVPTEKERQGDFSSTLMPDWSGNPIPVQIWNPFTATPVQGSTQVFERQPYANAIVTNPDAFGLKFLQAYPSPNHAPTDVYNHGNYFFSGNKTITRNNLSSRLDFRWGSKHNIYLSGGIQDGVSASPNRWGDSQFYNMAWPGNIADGNPYVSIGDTIALNSTTVVDLRYGLTRISTQSSFPSGSSFDYSAWGMPANVQAYVAVNGAAPSVGGMGNWNDLNNDGWARKNEHQTNHVFSGSFTKTLGKWTLKSGAEYRVYLGNWADIQFATPTVAMWGAENYTAQFGNINGSAASLNTTPQQGGFSGATAAVGAMGWNLAPGSIAQPALATKYMAVYSQNDWKATQKLTLNLGLRYEVQPGPTERYNHIYGVDLTKSNPYASGLSVPNGDPLGGMGAIAFPGVNGYSRNLWDTQWNNISPRIGAAYRLTNSTVLRGGYGRVYAPSNNGFNANTLIYGGAAFAGGTGINTYGTAPNGLPIGRMEDPQNTRIFPASGVGQAPNLYGNGNASSSVDLLLRNGYKNAVVDQWNVFIEHSFRGWLASAGYVGSRGSDLPWRGFPLTGDHTIPLSTLQSWSNQWIASNGLTNPGNEQVPNPIPQLVGGAVGPIGNSTISLNQSLQPYLGLLGQTVMASKGSSRYDAFQFRVEHAYSNGLQAMANYTWSHATGNSGGVWNSTYAESQIGGSVAPGGGTDYRNLSSNNDLLSYDIPHRFVGVLTYLLPTGKGKALDPHNKALRALIGDWQLGTVVTLQSGQAWAPSCGSINGRCIPTGEPLELPKSMQRWYDGNTPVTLPNGRTFTPPANYFLKWNPDAFREELVQFPDGTHHNSGLWYGTTAKYMSELRLPMFNNVNLSVNRKFRFTERVELELLAEATNLFNNTKLVPNTIINGFSSATAADPNTNTKVGQNSNSGFGSMQLTDWQGSNFTMDARQVTLSLRLRF